MEDARKVLGDLINPQDVPSEKYLETMTKTWRKHGYPLDMLVQDPLSARLIEENSLFPAFKFFDLTWEWDERGLKVPIKTKSGTEYKYWNDIRDQIYYINNNGWLMLENVYVDEHGLAGIETDDHAWNWKELRPCYTYKEKPGYCYLDVVSGSYEHLGIPGFGLMASHGHCWIEFGDEDGKLTSVGQWPDPLRGDDRLWTNWIFGSCKPVLIAPDPYTVYRGEKVVHRYWLGTGQVGKQNIESIKTRIMERHKENTYTAHNSFTNNCADFATCIEKFVQTLPKTYLMDLDLEEKFPPSRLKMKIPKKHKPVTFRSSLMAFLKFLYHLLVIFLINLMLNVLYFVPVLGRKMGKDVGVKVQLEEKEEEIGKLQMFKWKSPNWPRKLRINQQYSPRLHKHSMSFST